MLRPVRLNASKGVACARHFLTVALAGLVDYVVEAGASAEERGLVLARDIAQARPAAAHRSCKYLSYPALPYPSHACMAWRPSSQLHSQLHSLMSSHRMGIARLCPLLSSRTHFLLKHAERAFQMWANAGSRGSLVWHTRMYHPGYLPCYRPSLQRAARGHPRRPGNTHVEEWSSDKH